MPILVNFVPKYRKHRARSQAVVSLAGKTKYLGPHGTRASRLEYDRLIGEWPARGLPDARIRRLAQGIREEMCPDLPQPGIARRGSPDPAETNGRKVSAANGRPTVTPVARSGDRPQHMPVKWHDTRVIIFTEYDDTKRYLQQQLSALIEGSERADERIAIYHGPTPPAEREELKRALNTDPRKHPVGILIATDAAREGLNLQNHCWNLFPHFQKGRAWKWP